VYLKDGGVLWTIDKPKSVRDYEAIARAVGTKGWEQEVLVPAGARVRLKSGRLESLLLENGQTIRYTHVLLEEY
jgi:hypothetical protein